MFENSGSDCKLFDCNAGQPCDLLHVAQVIADFYGMKLGKELAVKFLDCGFEQTADVEDSKTEFACQSAA